MYIQCVPIERAVHHILAHNVVDVSGRRVIRKGVQLTATHIDRLRRLNMADVNVAILEPGDVGEEQAAAQLIEALQSPEFELRWGVGGRVNVFAKILGVLYVDEDRLAAINSVPGITLATRAQYAVVRPERGHDQVATLKVIPYAIPGAHLQQAMEIAHTGEPLLSIRPLLARSVALLLVGDPVVHTKLETQFEPPLQKRLASLESQIDVIRAVAPDETQIVDAITHLLAMCDLLIVAGQTSIMDENDLILCSLRKTGATVDLHGAPVDPGNLLALAYSPAPQSEPAITPILCAPGCARSNAINVVDLVLPRLLVGERLRQRDIARMGLGGLLH